MLAIYMTQVLLLGLAGSVLGVALAAAGAGRRAGVRRRPRQRHAGRIRADGVGRRAGTRDRLLVSMLFSLVPLLEVRHVKPSLLLRQDIPPPAQVRLAEVDGDGRRGRGAGGGRVVAGRIAWRSA